MHVTPFPAYPWLQVQVKLPGVFVHIALVLQLSIPAEHSSISDTYVRKGDNCIMDNYDKLTNAFHTISSISLVTGASEATRGICTERIRVAVINTSRTLTNI